MPRRYGRSAPAGPCRSSGPSGATPGPVAVSGEPLQTTQFWTTLVSLMPFHDGPVDAAIDAAYAAVDPASAMAEVVVDARHLHHAYRDDWNAARHAIHEKWVVEKQWNQNSTPANASSSPTGARPSQWMAGRDTASSRRRPR